MSELDLQESSQHKACDQCKQNPAYEKQSLVCSHQLCEKCFNDFYASGGSQVLLPQDFICPVCKQKSEINDLYLIDTLNITIEEEVHQQSVQQVGLGWSLVAESQNQKEELKVQEQSIEPQISNQGSLLEAQRENQRLQERIQQQEQDKMNLSNSLLELQQRNFQLENALIQHREQTNQLEIQIQQEFYNNRSLQQKNTNLELELPKLQQMSDQLQKFENEIIQLKLTIQQLEQEKLQSQEQNQKLLNQAQQENQKGEELKNQNDVLKVNALESGNTLKPFCQDCERNKQEWEQERQDFIIKIEDLEKYIKQQIEQKNEKEMSEQISLEENPNQNNQIISQENLQDQEQSIIQQIQPRKNLASFAKEYQHNTNFAKIVKELQKNYNAYRIIRGDGNCYFRAIGFAYLEHLSRRSTPDQELKKFIQKLKNNNGYYRLRPDSNNQDSQTLRQTLIQLLNNLLKHKEQKDKFIISYLEDEIKSNKNNQDEALVWEMRCLTANYLEAHKEFFKPFCEISYEDIKNVLTMGLEADDIGVGPLQVILQIKLVTISINRSDDKVRQIDLMKIVGLFPIVYILYKPGHYDLIYSKDQSSIDGFDDVNENWFGFSKMPETYDIQNPGAPFYTLIEKNENETECPFDENLNFQIQCNMPYISTAEMEVQMKQQGQQKIKYVQCQQCNYEVEKKAIIFLDCDHQFCGFCLEDWINQSKNGRFKYLNFRSSTCIKCTHELTQYEYEQLDEVMKSRTKGEKCLIF